MSRIKHSVEEAIQEKQDFIAWLKSKGMYNEIIAHYVMQFGHNVWAAAGKPKVTEEKYLIMFNGKDYYEYLHNGKVIRWSHERKKAIKFTQAEIFKEIASGRLDKMPAYKILKA